jgi:hypothetical protein
VHEWTALDVLDEIDCDDILTGRDRVDDVLRRSSERLGEAWMTQHAEDHRPLAPAPGWWVKSRHVANLRTPAALIREGTEMRHCVGGYIPAVEKRTAIILSLATPDGERSTAELTPSLQLAQHRGRGNGDPPKRHTWLLAAWLKRVREGKE